MKRAALILVAGLLLGVGAGWLAFGREDNGQRERVESAVAAEVTQDLLFVDCSELQSPSNTWTCVAYLDGGRGTANPVDYRATVAGESVNVERR